MSRFSEQFNIKVATAGIVVVDVDGHSGNGLRRICRLPLASLREAHGKDKRKLVKKESRNNGPAGR